MFQLDERTVRGLEAEWEDVRNEEHDCMKIACEEEHAKLLEIIERKMATPTRLLTCPSTWLLSILKSTAPSPQLELVSLSSMHVTDHSLLLSPAHQF